MKKKGFTLVELLVVIAIIALLMGILMPALAKVRQIAYRMVCGTNLSGIGKAMTLYANDFYDEFPRSGGRSSQWRNQITDWAAPTRLIAFGLAADESGGFGSITSSFYLLIKYTEVSPKSFICKSDSSVREFSLEDTELPRDTELTALWDFGPNPREHISYGYHFPFNNAYSLTTSSDPSMAVAADRNPWIEDSTDVKKDFSLFVDPGSQTGAMLGNSPSHQDESQNVLYVDVHVSQEKTSLCGVNEDNIYTKADGSAIGLMPIGGDATLAPSNSYDSLVVNDGSGTGAAQKSRACFLPDTPVWIDGQFVSISEVAANQSIDMLGTKVEMLQEHEGAYECRDLVLESGDCISVVDNHFFLLESGQWLSAPYLTSGMVLKTLDGTVAIKSITTREMPYVGKVYNVKVLESDQYMVGDDAVIVRDF